MHRDSIVQVKISSKHKHVVHFNVKAGDIIIWEFATKKKDIGFGKCARGLWTKLNVSTWNGYSIIHVHIHVHIMTLYQVLSVLCITHDIQLHVVHLLLQVYSLKLLRWPLRNQKTLRWVGGASGRSLDRMCYTM